MKMKMISKWKKSDPGTGGVFRVGVLYQYNHPLGLLGDMPCTLDSWLQSEKPVKRISVNHGDVLLCVKTSKPGLHHDDPSLRGLLLHKDGTLEYSHESAWNCCTSDYFTEMTEEKEEEEEKE
jgi:hypothetical protein